MLAISYVQQYTFKLMQNRRSIRMISNCIIILVAVNECSKHSLRALLHKSFLILQESSHHHISIQNSDLPVKIY